MVVDELLAKHCNGNLVIIYIFLNLCLWFQDVNCRSLVNIRFEVIGFLF